CAFTPAFVTGLKHDIAADGNRFHQEWNTFWKNNYAELAVPSRLEARELVTRIAELHGRAYRWDAQPFIDSHIEKLVSEWYRRQRPIGDLVRECVALLDSGESRKA